FQILLLQLTHYKYCIRCTFSRAEAKLHIIYLNSISHSCFYHSFKNFHCMLQQFYPSIRSTFHCSIASPLPLYILIIQLLHQSAGTLPSLTTALNRSVIHSMWTNIMNICPQALLYVYYMYIYLCICIMHKCNKMEKSNKSVSNLCDFNFLLKKNTFS